MPRFRVPVIGRLAAAAAVALAPAALGQFTINTTRIASGLSRPVYVTAPPGDNNRIFVVEQRSSSTGRIRIVNIPANTLNATPYLSVTGLAVGNEQGLLGMTFHPNFLQNGYFFVHYTIAPQSGISAGSVVIARYRANAPYATSTTADPASATILMTVLEPDENHNTGWIAFGPDGNLYIPLGDGGCGNDTNCAAPNTPSVNPPGHTPGTGNAQDLTSNLLGKILRIDVDGADNIPGNDDDDGVVGGSGPQYTIPATNPFNGTNGDREIWAYGIRNPWRDSFDRLTGDLWLADVGQGSREEVNFIPNGSGAGWNFGWRCMEGTRCTGLAGCTCNAAGLTLPILEYVHSGQTVIQPFTIQGCSITGGYVYRGNAIPCFRGHYIFADYCSGDIWTLRRLANGTLTDITNRTAQMAPGGGLSIANVTSFGEDAAGELYICDQAGGEVYKIIPGTATGIDCNSNAVPDACDIANGTSTDANLNGVPDECECDPDFNGDGNADQDDVAYLINVVGGGANPTGRDPDFTGDGNADQDDIAALINTIGGGGCP